MISFEPLPRQARGIIYELLASSYDEYLRTCHPEWQGRYRADWQRFDDEAFDHPDSVGRCVFLTRIDGDPIGFGSFDPRQRPARGIVGHNCIVPAFRGRGYGKRQMAEILRRLRDLGCRSAWVSTDDHPFFEPALRMYVSCGFRETSRRSEPCSPNRCIVLEAPLAGVA